MKSQVLEEYDTAVRLAVDDLLRLRAHAVFGECHLGAQKLLELGNYRLERVL